jgi:hypothetical protein
MSASQTAVSERKQSGEATEIRGAFEHQELNRVPESASLKSESQA